MNLIKCLFFSALVFAWAPNVVHAQDPFETIRISAGAGIPTYTNNFTSWTSPFGVGLVADTPFFVGELELGLHVAQWDSGFSNVPNFNSALIFGGWAVSSSPLRAIQLSSGLRIGNYFMAFDSQQVSGERNESEFALSPFVRIRTSLLGRLEGFVEAQATRVFTDPRLDFVQVSTGLSLTFDAPDWLKEMLE